MVSRTILALGLVGLFTVTLIIFGENAKCIDKSLTTGGENNASPSSNEESLKAQSLVSKINDIKKTLRRLSSGLVNTITEDEQKDKLFSKLRRTTGPRNDKRGTTTTEASNNEQLEYPPISTDQPISVDKLKEQDFAKERDVNVYPKDKKNDNSVPALTIILFIMMFTAKFFLILFLFFVLYSLIGIVATFFQPN